MRVDLLLGDRRSYTYEAYGAKRVEKHFEQAQVAYQKIYLSEGSLHEYMRYAQHSPPGWTLSFSAQPLPLGDILGIPHFLWLEGSLAPALHLLNSSYGRIGVHDQNLSEKLASAQCVYLPWGVDEPQPSERKRFDVVLFADLIDPSFLEKTWEELFSADEIALIKHAVEGKDPLLFKSRYRYVEQYLHACRTVRTVCACPNLRLDIFGEHAGSNWRVRLPQNIHLHSKLPFTEHFEVLKTSTIALMELTDPWFLPAIAARCLPLDGDLGEVNIHLHDPQKRGQQLDRLNSQLSGRSWENQIKQLLNLHKYN